MKYLRLACFWAVTAFAFPFGLSAETHIGDSMIYPTFRFYRGGAYASVTESTLSQIFADRLVGVPKGSDLPKRLAGHLYALCLRHRMDPAFVLSVIQAESSFHMDAVSSAGAVGLMQLMPATARVFTYRRISTKALQDPFLNLTLGVTYLKSLHERYTGLSTYYPLAAYNLGPHRLDQLRARPGFKPEKTLKYYEEIMRGIRDWRRYGSQALTEISTIPLRRSALKTKPDAQSKRTDSV